MVVDNRWTACRTTPWRRLPPAAHTPVTPEGSRASASVLELHKFFLPERRTMAKALRQRLAEVFFPNECEQFHSSHPLNLCTVFTADKENTCICWVCMYVT